MQEDIEDAETRKKFMALAKRLGVKGVELPVPDPKVVKIPALVLEAIENLRLYAKFHDYAKAHNLTIPDLLIKDMRAAMSMAEEGNKWYSRDRPSYYQIFSDYCKFHKGSTRVMKIVAGVTLGLGFLNGMNSIFNLFKPKKQVESQSWIPGEDGEFYHSTKADYLNRTVARDAEVNHARYGHHSGVVAQNGGMELEFAKIRRNMVYLQRSGKTMWGLACCGSQVILPVHFFMDGDDFIPDGYTIKMTITDCNMTREVPVSFLRSKMCCLGTANGVEDFCLYDFGLSLPPRANLMSKFLSTTDLLNLDRVDAYFVSSMDYLELPMALSKNRYEYNYLGQIRQFYLPMQWTYPSKSLGDCGKLLVAQVKGQWRILGMHIASVKDGGSFTHGMGHVVCGDVVSGFLEKQKSIVVQQAGVDFDAFSGPKQLKITDEGLIKIRCDLAYMGTVAGCHFLNGKDNWRPLPYLQESWHPHDFVPSVTNTRNPINPGHLPLEVYRVSLERVHKSSETKLLPQDVVEAAFGDVFDVISSRKPLRPACALPMIEMVNGRGHLAALDMRTAEGKFWNCRRPATITYPDGVVRPAKGKRWLFTNPDDLGNREINDRELKELVALYDESLRRGVIPPWLWTVILKAELRSRKKVAELNTRAVIGSPVDLSLLSRKYFGAFIDHLYSNPIVLGSAVGMNVFSSDWDVMISRMMMVSQYGFDGDFKFFERYFNAQFASALLKGINAWYKQDSSWCIEDDIARTTLVYAIMYACLLVGDRCYRSFCLMLSGGVITTPGNTVLCLALMRIAYILVGQENAPRMASIEHYRKLVVTESFGDDVFNAVSPFVSWFNLYNVSNKLAQYNIYFTSGSKAVVTIDDVKLTPLLECEFLKCTTVVRKNFVLGQTYFPKVKEETLFRTLSYSASQIPLLEATIINGNDVLARVWCSGKEMFNLWRARISHTWQRLGLSDTPITDFDIRKRWEDGEIYTDQSNPCYREDGYAYCLNAGLAVVAQSGVPVETLAQVVPTLPTPVTSIGDSGSDTKVDVYTEKTHSIGTIIKRPFPLFNLSTSDGLQAGIPTSLPLIASLGEFTTASGFGANGLLRYFSRPYRLYFGSFHCHVIGSSDDCLITSAASVDLASSASIGFGEAVNGYNQNGARAHGTRELNFVMPYVTRYKGLITPWFIGEYMKDTSNSSFYALNFLKAASSGDDFNGTMYCGASDGFRLACLCRIPSLKITSSDLESYPHTGGTAVDVEEFFALSPNAAGVEIQLSQLILDTWAPVVSLTTPATGVGAYTLMTVPTVNLTNGQLRNFGYNLKDGTPRNVLTGVTVAYQVTTNGNKVWVYPQTQTISSTPLATVTDPRKNWIAVGTGTTYSFVDQWGLNNQLATTWTMNKQNIGDTNWRAAMALPGDALLIPNNTTTTLTVTMTNTYSTSGYTFKRWNNGPIALGFGAPTLRGVKPKERRAAVVEKKEDFVKVYVAQSGSAPVVGIPAVKTDGGVQSLPNYLTMGEDAPSNKDVVMKEQIVDTVTWDTTAAAGNLLAFYAAPFSLIRNRMMQSAFTRYLFWRGDVTLRVQLQSNAFMNGSVVLCWMPLMTPAQAQAVQTGNLRSISVSKHAILYAGKCTTIDLTVPFLHPRGHLDLRVATDDNTLGTFLLYVQNPLRTGPSATSTAVTLTVFASFSNSDFAVINPTSVSVIPQGGMMSKVTNINIEKVTDSTIDAHQGSDEFTGGATSASGSPLDLPNVGVNPPVFHESKYSTIANTTNVNYCQVLDSGTSRAIVKPLETGTLVDEMDLHYLTQKMSFHSSFQITTANVLGEALFIGDLCPAFELFTLPNDASFTPTLLSFVSFPFSFWKGSLVYKIVAVANPVHTCRLQICSHIGFEAAGLDVDTAFGQYICTFEIGGGVREITISFPWRSPTDWKKVNTGSNSDTGNYSMGQWSVRVLNPLQAPETVSASLDCNVYMSGGPDFELAYLGENAIDLLPAEPPL